MANFLIILFHVGLLAFSIYSIQLGKASLEANTALALYSGLVLCYLFMDWAYDFYVDKFTNQ